MYNLTSVYTPKTLSELIADMAKNPDAVLLGGGTDLLSVKDYKNNLLGCDAILTSQVAELSRVYHSERYLELGSAVTIQQLLTTGAIFLSKEVYNAISNIATSVLRNQITIGGALFTRDKRYELAAVFSAIGVTCELKILTRSKRDSRRVRTSTRWVSADKLYNEDGSLIFDKDVVVTRVRIPSTSEYSQVFRTLGNPKHGSSSSVIFAYQYSMPQGIIVNPSLCIAFPSGGMITDFDSAVTSISFPIKAKDVESSIAVLKEIITERCPNISEIQLVRVCRLYQSVLYQMNVKYLAG